MHVVRAGWTFPEGEPVIEHAAIKHWTADRHRTAVT
jgi:hypothetical protein